MSPVRFRAPRISTVGYAPTEAPPQSAPLGWLCLALALLALVAAGAGLLTTGGRPSSVTTVHGETVRLYGEGVYRHDSLIAGAGSRGVDAVTLVHERSEGIPRVIGVICHNALISAFALSRRPVTAEIVSEVCQDFDLKSRGSAVSVAPSDVTDLRAPRERSTVEMIRRAPSETGRGGAARDMFAGLIKPRRPWYSVF